MGIACHLSIGLGLHVPGPGMYVSSIVKSILFADDTNLFLVGDDLKEVCETMSFELDKLSRWFQANKLSLNVSKTNFMIFKTRNVMTTIR